MKSQPTSNAGVAELDDTKLYYEVVGQGPPLVLIHAGVADCRMWNDQLNAFAARYKVVRYDVRGFGRSPNPAGTYTDYKNLHDLLTYLRIKKAHIVGMSNGGRIAIDFALAYPEMVNKQILVASAVSGWAISEEIKQGWAKEEAALEAGNVELAVEINLQMWVDGPNRAPDQVPSPVRNRVRQMLIQLFNTPEELDEGESLPLQPEALPLQPEAVTRLSEIAAHTLVIVGDQDYTDLQDKSNLLAREIPNASKVVIPGVAHLPNMENPDTFNQIVLDFLSEQVTKDE